MSIKTDTIAVQGSANSKNESSKKAKLFITLKRHANFKENMKKFNEIKEENEKTASKIQEVSKETKNNWDSKASNPFRHRKLVKASEVPSQTELNK